MTTLVVILLILAAGAAIVAQLVWWLSGRPDRERVPPPLVYPIHPRFVRQPDAVPPEPLPAPRPPQASVSVTTPVGTEHSEADLPVPVPVYIEPAEGDPALGETIQFVRPTDDALQLLPARLEVLSGMAPHQVIRFVRVPGKPAEMILGREAASSPQQVTLTSSTVSRRHARVTYDDGHWLVTNLSRTNPVVVNDHALAEFEGPRPLLDGDRIELGDVVLRFSTG